jgi:hypothetical protein
MSSFPSRRSSRPVRYNKSHHNNALSPEKDQYNFCGRLVVAGPMGLSRRFKTNPRCSLDYAKQLKPACQQFLFPSMRSFTDPPGFSGIRTTSAFGRSDVSSNANELCSSLSEEETVTHSFDNEDFLIAHDESAITEIVEWKPHQCFLPVAPLLSLLPSFQ